MSKKISRYHWFGLLGLLFWLADTFSKIFYIHLPQRVLWFCSLGFLITLVGYFRKNSLILTSVLCLLFIMETLWMLSLIISLFMGSAFVFTDISKYVFAPNYPKIRLFITMYHFLILPTIFVGLYNLKKIHQYGWVGATSLLLMFLILGYFFPDVVDNLNCSLSIPGDACYAFFGPFYRLGYFLAYPLASIFLGVVVFFPINLFAVKFAEKYGWKVEKKIKI